MNKRAKRLVLSALTTVMAAASLTVVTAPQASAINEVPCGAEFLQITIHRHNTWDSQRCYANAGEYWINFPDWWITRISTGNNRVQWYGDGRWQPDAPIDKWTVFTWPNTPGGVRFDAIKIH